MKSKPFGVLFGLLALVAILGVAPAFGQTENEVDIQAGAGSSANAACVTTNNCFSPNPITVAPGTEVTWKNGDAVSHTVTSGKVTDNSTGSLFDSGLIKKGAEFKFTFANAGTFDYFCAVHPWMAGQVIVSSTAAASTQSNDSTQTGSSMNMTSQSSGNVTYTGSVSTTASQPNNSTVQTNNVQSTTPVSTQNYSPPQVVNTTPASQDQISAWIAGIIIVAIMSGVGIWSAVRRR